MHPKRWNFCFYPLYTRPISVLIIVQAALVAASCRPVCVCVCVCVCGANLLETPNTKLHLQYFSAKNLMLNLEYPRSVWFSLNKPVHEGVYCEWVNMCLCVCMYVCMYVCVCVSRCAALACRCVGACMCTRRCVCICVCVHTCAIYVHLYAYVCKYVCACICRCACACMYACIVRLYVCV